MPLAFLLARPSESYALIERDIVSDNGGLADDRAHAVVDEETSPNFCAGMNLNPSKQARHLRHESCQKTHAVKPQPVAEAMCPNGVQSRIQEENLEVGASGRGRL